jgi:hypothetical protein
LLAVDEQRDRQCAALRQPARAPPQQRAAEALALERVRDAERRDLAARLTDVVAAVADALSVRVREPHRVAMEVGRLGDRAAARDARAHEPVVLRERIVVDRAPLRERELAPIERTRRDTGGPLGLAQSFRLALHAPEVPREHEPARGGEPRRGIARLPCASAISRHSGAMAGSRSTCAASSRDATPRRRNDSVTPILSIAHADGSPGSTKPNAKPTARPSTRAR